MRNLRALAFISALLLSAVLVFAADLAGRVTIRGKPLSGAVVTANLIGPKGPLSVAVTKTDIHGEYRLKGLHPGEYIVLVDVYGRRVYQGRLNLEGPAGTKNIELQ
jgi:hypothetical protein